MSVVETAVLGGATLVSNMSYGEFGNNAYLEPPTNDYTLEIQAGGTPVVAYDAPLPRSVCKARRSPCWPPGSWTRR